MKLNISKDLQLPADAVGQTFAILARRGAGKTYTAKVLAEEMLETGSPIVVLDPTGAWWGIRSSADGKVAGYPVVIMGGDHGDVPLEPSAGKVIADFLVAERVPTILDLSRFGEAEMQQFVADLADRFYRTNTEAVHWFVDEADEFAPQDARGGGPLWKCLGAMQRIVRRGRIKGIGCTLITQRSAVLNKSVLTQTECLITLQTTAPQDLGAIEDWLKYHATKEERPQIMSMLPRLQQGEAVIYSPAWLGTLKKVQIRKLRTFDSSRTPKPGEAKREPKRLADVDLNALQKQVAATIERAKADDPKELRKRIAELEREKKAAKPVVDDKAIERAVAAAVAERDREWKRQLQELSGKHQKCVKKLQIIHRESTLNGEAEPMGILTPEIAPVHTPKQGISAPAAAPRRREPPAEGEVSIGGGGCLRMLHVLADRAPARFTEAQWATMAGLKRTGGTWGTYKSRLVNAGMVEQIGGLWGATETAVAEYGDPSRAPQSPEELIADWKQKLGSGSARMIDALAEVYPNTLTREQLGEAVDISTSGGTFGTYLSRIRSNGLIEERGGEIKLADALMQ